MVTVFVFFLAYRHNELGIGLHTFTKECFPKTLFGKEIQDNRKHI